MIRYDKGDTEWGLLASDQCHRFEGEPGSGFLDIVQAVKFKEGGAGHGELSPRKTAHKNCHRRHFEYGQYHHRRSRDLLFEAMALRSLGNQIALTLHAETH
jgi:hypothetical protein